MLKTFLIIMNQVLEYLRNERFTAKLSKYLKASKISAYSND